MVETMRKLRMVETTRKLRMVETLSLGIHLQQVETQMVGNPRGGELGKRENSAPVVS